MNSDLIRLLATREGGQVRRCHVLPHISSYTVGLHTYGAVSLLLLLHPSPSLALIKAVQWHDVAERWMGDMPSPVKSRHPELGQLYERIERQCLKSLGLAQDLTADERAWLRAVDLLELYLWCREEERAGNGNVREWKEGIRAALSGLFLDGSLPARIDALLRQIDGRKELPRLSDHFTYVERDLNGPGEAGS